MKQYVARPCTCGRIHLIEEGLTLVPDTPTNRKPNLFVCTNCGRVHSFGYLPYGDDGFVTLGRDYSKLEAVLPARLFKAVILSRGLEIPMKSGEFATVYKEKVFIDEKTGCMDVDMEKVCKTFNEDQLRAISKNVDCKGFDWKGTKYY